MSRIIAALATPEAAHRMATALKGISSMATAHLLADLVGQYQHECGQVVAFESVGGVDAAKRVASGEAFDVAVLAANSIGKLHRDGHVLSESTTDIARSGVVAAIRAGELAPDISTESALRAAITGARSVGYSTGPSGVALIELIARWGVADAVRDRLVQAVPGSPVGQLIADGRVDLGFQQRSELMHLPGIDIIGPMPAGTQIETIFSAGVCATAAQPDAARALIRYLGSARAEAVIREHGMAPV